MKRKVFALPKEGAEVGSYKVVAFLSSGAQGSVYRAECAGRSYVLKFFQEPAMDVWARREVTILQNLEHPHVVGCRGWGRWPDPDEGSPYLVLEYVDGPTLKQYVQERNVSAREAGALAVTLAQTLSELLLQGVVHRDVKNTNILMRGGEPVFVDFGLGDRPGLSSVPGVVLFGTPEYISPEAYQYARNPRSVGRSFRPGDKQEQWALGVLLYWLYTDELPFGASKDGGDVQQAVLNDTPEAPDAANPRVPPEVSRVILRLLEKDPGGRYADMAEAASALKAATAQADAGWDAPLCEWEEVSTLAAPELPPETDESMLRLRDNRKAWRRRGRGRKREPVAPAQEEARPGRWLPSMGGGVPVGHLTWSVLKQRATQGALLALLLVGMATLWRHSTLAREEPETATAVMAPGERGGGKVAAGPESSEPPTGAEPMPASMGDDMTLNQGKTGAALTSGRKRLGMVKTAAAMCLAGSLGCATTPGTLPPGNCPPEALKGMESLGLKVDGHQWAIFPIPGEHNPAPPPEGAAVVRIGEDLGKLSMNDSVTGRFFIVSNRLYGRFHEARRRSDGQVYPVCLELTARNSTAPGVPIDSNGMVRAGGFLRPVSRFQE